MSWFRTLLHFFNLIEDRTDATVISISHVFMWVMIFVVVFVTIHSPTNTAEILGAIGGLVTAAGNYIHQRSVDAASKNGVSNVGSGQ